MSEVQRAGLQALYPFLADDGTPAGSPAERHEVLAALTESVARKATEIVDLRREMVESCGDQLAACAQAIATAAGRGGRLFTFGNGGSSCDAQQVATIFLHPARGWPVPAISLTNDIALVTALSNDVGFDLVFARQLAALAKAGDVAFGLSASGGSANVVRAFGEARRLGMLTVGLAGYDGGAMATAGLVDFLFVVPSSSIHRIQEVQTTLYHLLWELTQRQLVASESEVGGCTS
ncbi:phosphoheptose isomerase [Rhizocola hellebori]|uniref:Phosphoheptose isomerase n=1 Tax=Rhizocola hellebori TaxID=1392758 RepID=A0A8J3Q7X1_9ACTN|nr:SIS domain-containing protein [Rhizocola hellebori]GIH04867.1 phosphoheptose isomerase [Rhizocola hellebori]